MSRPKNRGRSTAAPAPTSDQARDELFQHVMRCGVIGSSPEHQKEWFDETMKYLSDRYHELNAKEIGDLRVLGERFAAPTVTPEELAPSESAMEPTADGAESGELDTVSAA